MSCLHATTTTLAWAYGEAPASHARHVAECPDCAATVADLELVHRHLPAAAPARRWGPALAGGTLAGLALAALALLAFRAPPPPAPAPPADLAAAIDRQLDELDVDVEALSDDPSLL